MEFAFAKDEFFRRSEILHEFCPRKDGLKNVCVLRTAHTQVDTTQVLFGPKKYLISYDRQILGCRAIMGFIVYNSKSDTAERSSSFDHCANLFFLFNFIYFGISFRISFSSSVAPTYDVMHRVMRINHPMPVTSLVFHIYNHCHRTPSLIRGIILSLLSFFFCQIFEQTLPKIQDTLRTYQKIYSNLWNFSPPLASICVAIFIQFNQIKWILHE